MSERPQLKNSPKICSPIASLKWFQQSFKILRASFWPFFYFALITTLAIYITGNISPFINFILSFFVYMFFTAIISLNCTKVEKGQELTLASFFEAAPQNSKQLTIASIIYFSSFLIIIFTALSPSVELFQLSEEQVLAIQNMNTQEIFKYWEAQIIENPEKYAPLITSSFILMLGLFFLEGLMFFVPILLAKHQELNAFQAIKLSLIGVIKNTLSFILLGIFLMPLMILSLSIYIIGLPLFLLILKITSFAAYKEIFLNEPDNTFRENKDSDKSESDSFDSRDF